MAWLVAFLGVLWGSMGDALMVELVGEAVEAQRAWCWQGLRKNVRKEGRSGPRVWRDGDVKYEPHFAVSVQEGLRGGPV